MTKKERDLLKVWIIQVKRPRDGAWQSTGTSSYTSRRYALEDVSKARWAAPGLKYRAVLYMPEVMP